MPTKKVTVIIPARMGSSRFPGKPLAKILDLPMIEHVRRRVTICGIADEIYVATCDDEIKEVVESYGGKVIMTAHTHERCTDRIEEAASVINADIVVNVQGDEPLLFSGAVRDVAQPLVESSDTSCSCLVYPIVDLAELGNINVVKSVLSQNNQIMYLSRSPIPHFEENENYPLYKQSGIMAFQKNFLHKYSRLAPTPLEKAESVDMLRILEHGYDILGVVTPYETQGVDVPEDIQRVERILSEDETQRNLYERILNL
ncbi:MAG: 3-deoxy-manno-octulosonate cytidylyltransferase [Chloroflexi bacterium]|jgi:3-deoxy-manno-octulosonate cytidylyltransferase (CMP-KDO synthetase)|nr:3-deoxy-manno-octulosonate cytidylyltransferase [Chloroflexota bacterium]